MASIVRRRTEMLKSVTRLLVAATAILMLSAPPAVIAPVSRATASASDGFRCGDPGVGAAGVVFLLSVGVGAASVQRCRRARRPVAR
jgi:hypothetical protein